VNIKQTTIHSYLTNKLLKSFLFFFVITTLIIFSNQIFIVISQSSKFGLYFYEILPVLLLKVTRDSQFIISLSFIISIIYILNKLYKNSEMLILENAGINEVKIFKYFRLPIFFFAIVSILTSLFISPHTNKQIKEIQENAKLRPDFVFLNQGEFRDFQDGKITFYASKIIESDIRTKQLLEEIFLFNKNEDKLILSKKGEKSIDEYGQVYLSLSDGKIYSNLDNEMIAISNFEKLSILLFKPTNNIGQIIVSPNEKDSFSLIKSSDKEDLTEFLYRISLPISLVIQSLLSILFAKTFPRSKYNLSLIYGVMLFVGYYNSLLFVKTLSNSDVGNTYINFSLLHLFFLILAFIIYLKRNNYQIMKLQ